MEDGKKNTINQASNDVDIPVSTGTFFTHRNEGQTGGIENYIKTLKDIKKEAADIKKETLDTNNKVNKVENLVNLGFIFLVFMMAGLLFSYIEFVYSGSKNDDYKYELTNSVSETKNDVEILKLCLSLEGWLSPKCLK